MKNGEFCNREVVIAERNSTIGEIAGLMKKFHSGDVIIVDKKNGKNYPVGIVTDRDIIIKVNAEGIPANSISAEDIMSDKIYTIPEESSIWETLVLMREKGIRRIPVINNEKSLVGILTVDDVIEIIAEELMSMAKTIRNEQSQEEKRIGSL